MRTDELQKAIGKISVPELLELMRIITDEIELRTMEKEDENGLTVNPER